MTVFEQIFFYFFITILVVWTGSLLYKLYDDLVLHPYHKYENLRMYVLIILFFYVLFNYGFDVNEMLNEENKKEFLSIFLIWVIIVSNLDKLFIKIMKKTFK